MTEGTPTGSITTEISWPLEASRVSLDDPLMECLSVVAAMHGRRATAAALSAGLPLHGRQMASPAAFIRAADRIGMTARMVKRPIDVLLSSPNLPCILVLKKNLACILLESDGQKAKVIFPETPDTPVLVDTDSLQKQFFGYAFFVRPRPVNDGRLGKKDQIDNGHNWFWGALWRHRKAYRDVIVATTIVNIIAALSPLFTMNVYDRVVPNKAYSTLWVLALGVSLAYIFDFLLKNLRAHFVDAAGRKADNLISARIFEQVLAIKMANRPPSVGVHAAHIRDFETLRDFFTSATLIALIDFPFLLLFILLIGLIAGPLATVPLVAVPLVIVIGLQLQKPLSRVIKEALREGASKTGILFETLSGLETIKVQAAEGHMQRKWEELNEHASLTSVKGRAISSFGLNLSVLITNLVTVVMVIWGCYLIGNGDMTMGALIAAVILTGRAMAPLTAIAGILTKYSQSRESLSHLEELMKTPVERAPGQAFISMNSLQGRIDFRDVTFKYPNQNIPALQSISIGIQPGQKIGIIGPVGSGKTTLERLILNLYQPESGSVQVDGVDVRQIDPADLRRNIGVVQQTPYLFYGTVRENITLGHEAVPDSAILRAAELAGVMDFLRDTEAGLDTMVGERGENLSGGQRQAIAIARALLYDPAILLLDEPTASIDPGSERRLYNHLLNVTRNKTVILITHKSAVLGLVDYLILMDRGRIIAAGPRDEILQKLQSGAFKTAGAVPNE